MIYTSYFAKLKNLPKDVVPISICGKAPAWYNGLQFKELAPKYDFFMKWKTDHDNEYYVKCFNEQVLSNLDCDATVKRLLAMAGNFKSVHYLPAICLVCYEKPGDFCHRHLVAEWLKQNGFECQEL